MKSKLILLVLFLVLPFTSIARDLTLTSAPAQIYFSPNGGCTKAIVAESGAAKSEVLIGVFIHFEDNCQGPPECSETRCQHSDHPG
jgi:hypothetical protein